MKATSALATWLVVLSGCAANPPPPASDLSALLTRAERTDYRETTSYDEVVAFLRAIDTAWDRAHLTTFGYTYEGRTLPLLVVGDTGGASAEAVHKSGRLRVWLQGNIHGGEVCGKEALLALLRDLASGTDATWLDDLVLLVAPIYNADGNERVRADNRPRQHGPIGGMGQRRNAQQLDLNRDHMKLESPEARSLVAALNAYDPEVVVDLHTTNGTRHGYHLTYAPPLHPNTPAPIDELLRGAWLPAVTASIKRVYDWDYYYYGNVSGGDDGGTEPGWRTFDHRPRFNNNYVGLRNRFGILSEAYAYATFEERVQASRRFVEAVLGYAATNAPSVRDAVAAAAATPIVGQTLAVRARPKRSDRRVEILMGGTLEEVNPYSGGIMLRRTSERRPEPMYEYGTFDPTVRERVPAVYYVPPALSGVIERLMAHGIRLERLDDARQQAMEQFVVTRSSASARSFEGHLERTLEGSWQAAELTLPAGTAVVDVDQPLGRLAFTLLEPRSDDGLANWNVLDDALDGTSIYPILRTAP